MHVSTENPNDSQLLELTWWTVFRFKKKSILISLSISPIYTLYKNHLFEVCIRKDEGWETVLYKDHVNLKKKNWFGIKYNHFGKTENSECVQFFCKLFYYNLRHCSINKVAKHRDCQWPTVVLQICTSILGCTYPFI